MTDIHQGTLSSTTREDLSHRRQPLFTSFDVLAFLVAVLMVWGPLAAGALRQ